MGSLEGEGGIGAGGGGGGGGTSSLALGSACSLAISFVFLTRALGDVSGVCNISLNATTKEFYLVLKLICNILNIGLYYNSYLKP